MSTTVGVSDVTCDGVTLRFKSLQLFKSASAVASTNNMVNTKV